MSISFKNGSHLGAVRKIAIICLGCTAGDGDFSREVEVVVADIRTFETVGGHPAEGVVGEGHGL